MPWEPEVWVVVVPNPFDPFGNWIGPAENFDTEAGARGFVQDMGGDTKGRIYPISFTAGEGWTVDLPDPEAHGEQWQFIEAFKTKREAIAFVREHFFGDSKGRIPVVDVMESLDPGIPDDPREWIPRKMRDRS